MEIKDILIVDDDENMNFALSETLSRKNYSTDRAFSFLEAKEKINFFSYPMVITDVRMPDGNGIKLVSEIKKKNPDTAVIVITAFGKIEDAVNALKNGAQDYILKPFQADKILKLVENHFPTSFNPKPVSEFLTVDKNVMELLDKVKRAAKTDVSIMITGESGTGKEVLARIIHNNSNRADFPYIPINCAAIPDNLLESELFGYEKGAFTGAEKFKPGKFELAHKGTLVLDEIGDMPLNLQAKILRVLQEKEVDRLGGSQTLPVDVRTISLTNKNIEESIKEKKFRDDLFFRLNIVEFNIPPLRDRKEDIGFLAMEFLKIYQHGKSQQINKISDRAISKLQEYKWPGNIRELQNVIQRALIFCEGKAVDEKDIEFNKSIDTVKNRDEIMTVAEMERNLIFKTLEKTDGNKAKAAEMLGISSRTLRNKLKEYGQDTEE